jgi:hypothetical protein
VQILVAHRRRPFVRSVPVSGALVGCPTLVEITRIARIAK